MRLRGWKVVAILIRLGKRWVDRVRVLAVTGNGEGLSIAQGLKTGVEMVDLVLEGMDVRIHCPILAVNTISIEIKCRRKDAYSESLKSGPPPFVAYTHSSARLPQRWQGVLPLHLILRLLHSLQAILMYRFLFVLACPWELSGVLLSSWLFLFSPD